MEEGTVPCGSIGTDKGFTLLEIMVAVTILSFIFGVVYTTFATISDSDKKIHSSSEITLKVRNLVDYMMRDISSAFVPAKEREITDATLSYGFFSDRGGDGSSGIDFTTMGMDSGSILYPFIQEVGYYLSPVEGGGYRLIKREDRTPDNDIRDGGRSFELMDGIAGLRFSFLDGSGEWKDEWDSSGGEGLPRAVRIDVTLPGDDTNMESFTTQFPVYQGLEF